MLSSNGPTIPLALAVLALASCPSMVSAQGNTFNPYGNSGYADYREFSTPMVSNNPALPGQARLNQEPLIGRQRGNSYQRYLEELEGADSGLGASSRETTSRLPYYEAYQQQNRLNNRVYKPNDTQANRDFEARQRQRNAAYAKALEEKDMVKRNRLLRQIDQDVLNSSRTRPASGTSTPATGRSATGAGTSRATAPAALPSAPPPPLGDRRSAAPSPYAGGNAARRQGSTVPRPTPPANPATPDSSTTQPEATSRPATGPSPIPIPPPR